MKFNACITIKFCNDFMFANHVGQGWFYHLPKDTGFGIMAMLVIRQLQTEKGKMKFTFHSNPLARLSFALSEWPNGRRMAKELGFCPGIAFVCSFVRCTFSFSTQSFVLLPRGHEQDFVTYKPNNKLARPKELWGGEPRGQPGFVAVVKVGFDNKITFALLPGSSGSCCALFWVSP